ncbi:hypothetical protein OAL52_00220 [bacterium]|nr:hypothetical protein [bacterium]
MLDRSDGHRSRIERGQGRKIWDCGTRGSFTFLGSGSYLSGSHRSGELLVGVSNILKARVAFAVVAVDFGEGAFGYFVIIFTKRKVSKSEEGGGADGGVGCDCGFVAFLCLIELTQLAVVIPESHLNTAEERMLWIFRNDGLERLDCFVLALILPLNLGNLIKSDCARWGVFVLIVCGPERDEITGSTDFSGGFLTCSLPETGDNDVGDDSKNEEDADDHELLLVRIKESIEAGRAVGDLANRAGGLIFLGRFLF